MQKIIKQDLGGSEEQAREKAQYTWVKDEIAWMFDANYRDIFKVKFTGEHWIVGNKWGREKIYQYQFLDSSGEHNLKLKGHNNEDGISHDSEDAFFTDKKDALNAGYDYIAIVREDAINRFDKDSKRLMEYAKLP